jgi:hypothetical protein
MKKSKKGNKMLEKNTEKEEEEEDEEEEEEQAYLPNSDPFLHYIPSGFQPKIDPQTRKIPKRPVISNSLLSDC